MFLGKVTMVVLLSVTILSVTISGCGSAASPSAAVPAAATGLPATPSPTASLVPRPTATPFVSAGDEAGARAFVTAYFVAVDRALNTGDVAPLEPYRLATCICVRLERDVRQTYGAGGRITGAKLAILKWAYRDHGPSFARTAIYFFSSVMVRRPANASAVVEPGFYGDYFVDLKRSGSHWVIDDIRLKQEPSP